MKPVTIIILGIGALLLWAGIRNKNPLETVKSVLTTGKVGNKD